MAVIVNWRNVDDHTTDVEHPGVYPIYVLEVVTQPAGDGDTDIQIRYRLSGGAVVGEGRRRNGILAQDTGADQGSG